MFIIARTPPSKKLSTIDPLYRDGWLLENYLIFVFIPIILLVGRYFKLSDVSYTLITIFLILHVIGSHYTYAEVPFGYTLQEWTGAPRNMYDRLVHFSFGFLLVYPLREIFMRLARARGIWGYYFPIDVMLALSGLYEIIEWLAAARVDPKAGLAFLGTQGDIWDAQKDMTLATGGAIVAMIFIALVNAAYKKNFWREIKESVRIEKEDAPLGEIRLKEMLSSDGIDSKKKFPLILAMLIVFAFMLWIVSYVGLNSIIETVSQIPSAM